ncbi:MAG: hypothetical protein ABIP95_06140 [Pelobium sp.]
MNKFKFILLITFCATSLFSCKKGNETPSNSSDKNLKLTVTVSGFNKAEGDYISFVAVGSPVNSDNKTIWKINGVAQANEQGIGLSGDDFSGSVKTYVLESNVPINIGSVSIQGINFGSEFKISYKAELNGKILNNDENISVAVDKDYTHNYNY